MDRSADIATAVPPAARIAAAVLSIVPWNRDWPGSVVLAATATAAPSAPNRSAMAAPMPRLAPVTMAIFPSRTPTSITPLARSARSLPPGSYLLGQVDTAQLPPNTIFGTKF